MRGHVLEARRRSLTCWTGVHQSEHGANPTAAHERSLPKLGSKESMGALAKEYACPFPAYDFSCAK